MISGEVGTGLKGQGSSVAAGGWMAPGRPGGARLAPVSQNDALGRKTESRAIEPLRGAAAEDAGLYGARYVLQGTHIGRCADCGKAAQKAARRRRRFNLARLLTVSTGGDP